MITGSNKTIFAFSGKARSGKNQAAIYAREFLEQKGLRVVEVSFAMALKAACQNWFGWNPETKNSEGRTLLQEVGAACRSVNEDFWVDFVTTVLRATEAKWDVAIVTDLRYANEIKRLEQTGYNVIHTEIHRDGVENLLTPEQQAHESEHGLDGVSPMYEIYNNSTLEKLKENVEFVVSRHAGRRCC